MMMMMMIGFTTLVNVDSSRVVIDQNIERYKESRPILEWKAMNVTQLDFSDESFDAVIAKGTFDAILCGENAIPNISAFCSQVSRILKPGGTFLIVSYGTPDSRLSHLSKEEYNWRVSHQTIPKPTISSSAIPLTDEANNVHYIYICEKQGGPDSSD
jgi:ubiquinone/menaquinone biosynthesis C-methylase UbiE